MTPLDNKWYWTGGTSPMAWTEESTDWKFQATQWKNIFPIIGIHFIYHKISSTGTHQSVSTVTIVKSCKYSCYYYLLCMILVMLLFRQLFFTSRYVPISWYDRMRAALHRVQSIHEKKVNFLDIIFNDSLHRQKWFIVALATSSLRIPQPKL